LDSSREIVKTINLFPVNTSSRAQ